MLTSSRLWRKPRLWSFQSEARIFASRRATASGTSTLDVTDRSTTDRRRIQQRYSTARPLDRLFESRFSRFHSRVIRPRSRSAWSYFWDSESLDGCLAPPLPLLPQRLYLPWYVMNRQPVSILMRSASWFWWYCSTIVLGTFCHCFKFYVCMRFLQGRFNINYTWQTWNVTSPAHLTKQSLSAFRHLCYKNDGL